MANGTEVDMDVAWQRAGLALDGLPRDDALHLACMNCDHRRVPWVREAYMRKVLRAKCLGRFDLDNPARIDLPWPSTVFIVQGPVADQQAMLMVYMGPDGGWTVADEGPVQRPDGSRGIVVDTRRYQGNLDGVPGTVNGDDAGGGMPVSPERPAPAPEIAAPSTPRTPAAGRPARRARPPARKQTSSVPAPNATPAPVADMSPKAELLLRLLRFLEG